MTVHLKDIAAYTGVSAKTVSNVINGNYGRVSEKTRIEILAAIEKLNYQPNIAARHLRNAHVNVLALAFPDFTNPYFTEVANLISTIATENSYTVLFDNTRGKRENELLLVNGLHPYLIDGLILDAHSLTDDDLRPEGVKKPIVLLGERFFDAPYDHIVIDNVAAARAITQHLLSVGKKRIAIIGTTEHRHTNTPALRLQGYLQAIGEAGYKVDAELLVHTKHWERLDGAEAMRQLLALNNPPDAIFCMNDLLALGAMSVLHEASIRIPQEIAVAGIDDIEDGRYATPALTSISPNKEQISRIAISLLLERIKGTNKQPAQRVMVPFTLKVRKSTCISES